MSISRTRQLIILLLVSLVTLQAQNPITAAREAFRKAQEETRRKQEEARPNQQGQAASSQPVVQPRRPPQSEQVLQAATAPVPVPQGTAETTAKIAASLGYLDVAGIKLGMPLASTVALLKTINPRFQLTPQTEIIWPLDRSNTAAQPPPDAPKSTVSVTAESQDVKGNVETFGLSFAQHPNAPIVIGIQRKLGWAPNTGPGIDDLVDDLRKKYGPESLITNQMTNNSQRWIALRWYYDPSGLKLQGNLAQQPGANCNVVLAGPASGLCGTLAVLDVAVQAPGNGVVSTLMLNVASHPLTDSARAATAAYLKAVEEERANRQRRESSERARPKL